MEAQPSEPEQQKAVEEKSQENVIEESKLQDKSIKEAKSEEKELVSKKSSEQDQEGGMLLSILSVLIDIHVLACLLIFHSCLLPYP